MPPSLRKAVAAAIGGGAIAIASVLITGPSGDDGLEGVSYIPYKDTGKRKTFVNTTLGETWEAKIGERPDAEVMAERKEHYSAPVPDRVAYLTAGIDSQLDRYEMRVWGWGPGEESWLIDRQIIMGRHDDEQTLLRVDEAINKTYTRRNGAEMSISRICWDIGGIDPTIVYERSKKHGLFRVIPIKGASVYGKPVASMPRKRNKNGVYLTEIGTDTAKEQIYNRFTLTPEGDEPLTGQRSSEVCFRSEDIRDERESVGNQRRILKNGCRIVRQFGGVIGIICVCFKR